MSKVRQAVKTEANVRRLKAEVRLLRAKYKEALRQNTALAKKLDTIQEVKSITSHGISVPKSNGKSEATAICLASDWHVEEVVKPETVNLYNEYNPQIARERADKFFQRLVRLLNIFQKDIPINTLVLALLGDFFSNDIHDELAEQNAMLPVEAIMFSQDLLASGIKYLLRHSKVRIEIPCVSGNHARTTRRVHVSHEYGHSLEHYMYHSLAKYFAREPRVNFHIAESSHIYMDVYGMTIRFLHGTDVRYYGGVGGLTIPLNKAIAQWDKLRKADLTVLG